MTYEKRTKLNNNGVKDSADMWRTFGGELYPHWTSEIDEERIKAYRYAGVRCRRVKDELFVHEADQYLAAAIDVEASK